MIDDDEQSNICRYIVYCMMKQICIWNTKFNKPLSNTRKFSFVQKFSQIFITYNASVRNKNKKNILLLWKIKFSQIIIKAEQNTS